MNNWLSSTVFCSMDKGGTKTLIRCFSVVKDLYQNDLKTWSINQRFQISVDAANKLAGVSSQ